MVMSIILAAGKGTRMVSDLPKVLHPLMGAPLLEYMLDKVEALGCSPNAVVVGYKHELVRAAFPGRHVIWAHQHEQLGTGHAATMGVEALPLDGEALILNGDLPLLTLKTLEGLLAAHRQNAADVTLLTCVKSDPYGYGRIQRHDKTGKVVAIAEEKDASPEVKRIKEINVGVYVFRMPVFRECYAQVRPDNVQKEYYLTDVVVAASRLGKRLETCATSTEEEIAQVNSRGEMAQVSRLIRLQILEDLMAQGVTIDDPHTTYIEKGVRIGKDARILPFTYIERGVDIAPGCEIGPFTHLRPGTVLQEGASLGNFVEIKASVIGEETKVRHMTYIGDATIGKKVNVGAGTIFANFDGRQKNKSVVKDGAFIGCGTIFVAPVTMGEEAVTGAGAVVTKGKNVPDRTVVVGVPARPLQAASEKTEKTKKTAE
ncbi:MAG: bifunctional N-acetylglucosamine-1-phosphate uridyltransferase/glucosamine-1-phosphate acetyltransferase [Planctomycetes bacterium]|nr:bifunctional N-acetylglucosamine-1-phosphate uridyltransferase/glucosamine-1-phosphate acetyltransferase [Planctomycetota bacterium]